MGSDSFLYALIRHAKEIFKENQRFSKSFKDFQRVSEISREIPRFPEKVKSPRDFLRFSEILVFVQKKRVLKISQRFPWKVIRGQVFLGVFVAHWKNIGKQY